MSEKTSGERAEAAACDLLRDCGYEIVARNWRTRRGEIDIVARDGPVLAMVEVKARSGQAYGRPEEAVDRAKQRRIVAATRAFLAATGCSLAVRFDVVTFLDGAPRLFRDAFQAGDECSHDS